MKAELYKHPSKGICILISEIAQSDFLGKIASLGHGFTDIGIIADEIRKGRKIAAIKEVRAQSGWGLKEAKYYIDNYIPMGYGHDDDFEEIADRFIKDHLPKDFIKFDDFNL